MDTSDWLALIVPGVGVIVAVLAWRTSRRSARASERSAGASETSAQSSASSAEASQRAVKVAERAEQRALAEREEARGPEFRLGDRQDSVIPAVVTLNGDVATVLVAQVSGPELDKVMISTGGPVDGVNSPEGAGGHSLPWDRPTLLVPKTVQVVGDRPDKTLDAELVLGCTEREPGTGRWERRYSFHAVASAYGPRLGTRGD
ncbi:MAG: hypothetical protein GEU83_03110 [Pseudonocardiaceae bacterium]|nr:hypothetical protein [Pseudonocardiaceae bacterium]